MYVMEQARIEIRKKTNLFAEQYIENVHEKKEGCGKFSYDVLEAFWKEKYFELFRNCRKGELKLEKENLDVVDVMNILNTIAYYDVAPAHFLATINFCFFFPLMLYKREDLIQKCFLEHKLGILAFTEETNEVNATCEYENGSYVLKGKKHLIAGLEFSDYALVNALLNGENTIFIVDLHQENVEVQEINESMGLQTLKMWDIKFDNVNLSESSILGGPSKGFEVIAKVMELMRIANSAISLGGAERAYAETVSYCKNRTISKELMYDMQYIRYKLAEMKTDLEIMKLSVFYTAEQYQNCIEKQFVISSLLKYYVTEKAKKICDSALQFWGGNGYLKNTIIERLYRDMRIMTIAGGSSESLLDIISRII